MAKLRDLMHTGVVTVAPDTTVSEAAASMVRARVGSVIVLQGSFLAGILTERDVLRAAASGENLSASVVSVLRVDRSKRMASFSCPWFSAKSFFRIGSALSFFANTRFVATSRMSEGARSTRCRKRSCSFAS